MTKKIIFGVILLIVFIIAVYWYYSQSNMPKASPISETIRIGVQDNIASALIGVAGKQGFFTKSGLDVQIVQYQSGKLAAQALFDDKVDVALVSENIVMNNSLNRTNFSIFSEAAFTDRGSWIIARRDHGISQPLNLKGKTIGTQKDSAVHFFLSMFLLFNNINEDEVKLEFYQPEDLPKAFQVGKIDAFSMRDPYIAQAIKLVGADNVVEFKDTRIYKQYYNLIAKNIYILNNKKILEKVLKALIEAEDYIKKYPDTAKSQMSEFLGGNQINEINNTWSDYNFMVGLSQAQILILENEYRWKTKNNVVMPNYLDFFNYQILDKVKPEAITIIY
ncbi:MAG: ABC-type nitrate/sulfonate/bicarbonate transport system periplasmic component-like protein [Candidatus Magasanikbacteria bacterium GW2011_GWA2_37_8]|uniref:ABC-type nitrate/sulfonate/bicarbonate transport system periplasmic component-like protein n=1 Tax=Candidatus Magasanikbacteria bacterium GW2011_GWA2_37_8 TaxID=1619036 RepID=A0A0G0HQL1_9BACT|nr:MAG: ABC-type nitrate/sulfonate/bicarbonate transport system periplasmic component-like protein [Candidatus Magasanikbacteria bacterium GW2011_GWA2_37_8]